MGGKIKFFYNFFPEVQNNPIIHVSKSETPLSNVRSVKKDTKCSSNTLLCMVSFFTERTLANFQPDRLRGKWLKIRYLIIGYASFFLDSDNTESDKYILQVAGINEYLQNDSLLQDYVYVHECYKFDRDVEFIVLLRDNNLKTLARTADDDKIDAKVTVSN